ncbi:hypothetical protein EV126DRAFT_426366, partial [Verticillium dahliae]
HQFRRHARPAPFATPSLPWASSQSSSASHTKAWLERTVTTLPFFESTGSATPKTTQPIRPTYKTTSLSLWHHRAVGHENSPASSLPIPIPGGRGWEGRHVVYNVSPSACSCRHPTNGLVHRDHAFPRTTLCTQSCSAATISSPFSTEPVWLRLALHRPLHPRGRSLVRLLPRNMVTQWGDPSPSSLLARARPHMHMNACAYTQDRPLKEHTNRHRVLGPPRLRAKLDNGLALNCAKHPSTFTQFTA